MLHSHTFIHILLKNVPPEMTVVIISISLSHRHSKWNYCFSTPFHSYFDFFFYNSQFLIECERPLPVKCFFSGSLESYGSKIFLVIFQTQFFWLLYCQFDRFFFHSPYFGKTLTWIILHDVPFQSFSIIYSTI